MYKINVRTGLVLKGYIHFYKQYKYAEMKGMKC